MLHLATERLAELVDAPPTLAESEHLESCAHCRGELAQLQRVTLMAIDERRRIGPPVSDWYAIRDALRGEGLLAAPESEAPAKEWRIWWSVARIAAGVLVVAGSTLVGRMSTGLTAREAAVNWGRRAPSTENAIDPAFASGTITSETEAYRVMAIAQDRFDRANAFFAARDTLATDSRGQEQYRTRLAALDRMVDVSGAALRDAPADPVLNQYYFSTLGARESTLRKIGSSLPTGQRLVRW